jgi:regulator of protease activity HflC (stomatin/prohibitin superfamily)
MEWLMNMERAAWMRIGVWLLSGLVGVASFLALTGMRYIPNNKVGIVEKLWSLHGHVREGRLMALPGQTGYQMAVLRGGIYFFFWPWLYRIHKLPLTVTAEAENRRQVLIAEAEGKSRMLLGEGQAKRVAMEGEAEANVLRQKVASYGDPRLYALSLVSQYLAQSQQPLVPQHLFLATGDGAREGVPQPGLGLLGTLISLLVAEKTGWPASAGHAAAVPPREKAGS